MRPYAFAVVVVASGGTGMAAHHTRLIALAAVLVGISALVPLAACNGAQQTLDEQQVLAEGEGDLGVASTSSAGFGASGAAAARGAVPAPEAADAANLVRSLRSSISSGDP